MPHAVRRDAGAARAPVPAARAGCGIHRACRRRLGGRSTALHLAGGPTGAMLHDLLDREGVDQRRVRTEGWTRENLTVGEEPSGRQFRFGMQGPHIREDEWARRLEELEAIAAESDWMVASGSLPPGVPEGFYGRVAEIAARTDARLVVDTSGPALRAAVMTPGTELGRRDDMERLYEQIAGAA